jgi:hypothetical protein
MYSLLPYCKKQGRKLAKGFALDIPAGIWEARSQETEVRKLLILANENKILV